MRVSFDIHGVIDEKPEFFKVMLESLVKCDHEVHILSGPPTEQILADLEGMGFKRGVHYTHLFSIVDFHKSLKTPMTQDERGWHMDLYLWDRTKADYCLKHGIDMHLDDSDTYSYFFKTPYARYFSKNKRKHHIKKEDVGEQ